MKPLKKLQKKIKEELGIDTEISENSILFIKQM